MKYNKIVCGDCVDIMKHLPDTSIDMVITSPPYDNLREYKGNVSQFQFKDTAQQLYRVLKVGGVIIWVVGDATIKGSETGTSWRQALYFKKLGLNIHDTMLYHKINYIPLTHNRYEQCWEYMFCFSKGKPKTFNPIKIPAKGITGGSSGWYEKDGSTRMRHSRNPRIPATIKISSNIFSYPIGIEKNGHPAVFPTQLAMDQITSWTHKGDIVLDPFFGSGTTGVAAERLDRSYVGIELSEEYCNIAKQRLDVATYKYINAKT